MRENWMFKLVGRECFSIGKHKCVINIDSSSGFAYEYSLDVYYSVFIFLLIYSSI
jgi:hypothetical protein